jgi:hypothetical protein
MDRMVAWESLLERDALLLLELSPGVVAYQEQPEEIRYWDGEAIRSYVPDLLVTLHDEHMVLIEIKPRAELARPNVRAKYGRIAEHLQTQGRAFRLLTEEEIRLEPQFSTLQRLLYRYNHPASPLPSGAELASVFQRAQQIPLAQCEASFGADGVHTLIAQGRLFVDLSLPITAASLLRLPTGDAHAAIFF